MRCSIAYLTWFNFGDFQREVVGVDRILLDFDSIDLSACHHDRSELEQRALVVDLLLRRTLSRTDSGE